MSKRFRRAFRDKLCRPGMCCFCFVFGSRRQSINRFAVTNATQIRIRPGESQHPIGRNAASCRKKLSTVETTRIPDNLTVNRGSPKTIGNYIHCDTLNWKRKLALVTCLSLWTYSEVASLDQKLCISERVKAATSTSKKESALLIHPSKKSQSLPDSSLFPVCCLNATDVKCGTEPGSVMSSSDQLKERNVRDIHLHSFRYGSPRRKQLLKLTSLSADWSFKRKFSLKNDYYKCVAKRHSASSHGNLCQGN